MVVKPDPEFRPDNPAPAEWFTVREVADELKLSDDTTRRLFQGESGVLKIESGVIGKRRHVTLRISREAKERIIRRLSA